MSVGLCELSVAYGDREVVHGVSASVAPGRWLMPIGPNGAGKSTMLRAIAGLVPFSGEVTLAGVALAPQRRRQLSRLVAYVPQRPQLPIAMRVLDYVMLGRNPYIPYLGRESRHDRLVVTEVLERLDLLAFVDRELGALSGGEAQQVVLARAFAQSTPILLLDEPTASLDLGHQQQVLELVDELRQERGLTVLSTMHDLTLAGQFGDSLLLMAEGRVVASGSAQEVLTEQLLERHYHAQVRVTLAEDGTVLVFPKRSTACSGRDRGLVAAVPAAQTASRDG